MTTEEMMAEARAAAKSIASTVVSTRQRLFMPAEELTVLLMDAYARGVSAQSRRAVQAFAPQMMTKYDRRHEA